MKDKKDIWIVMTLTILIVIAIILKYKLTNNDPMDLIIGLLVGLTIGKSWTFIKKKNQID